MIVAQPQKPPVPRFNTLPDRLIAKLPEPRRTLHREAVEVVTRNAVDGTPFVLMLRSYAFTQLFASPKLPRPTLSKTWS
jgi:hypothetical protein